VKPKPRARRLREAAPPAETVARPQRTRRTWLVALAAALVLLAIDSATRLHMIRDLAASSTAGASGLARDPASPTGFVGGQRDAILPDAGLDGYQWLMQTQQMLADGGWRVRHVTYDNAPAGRPVHWSSAFRWWLAVVAAVDSLVTSAPVAIAVETVAPWANTLLFLGFAAALVPLMARRLGGVAAGVLAVAMVTVYPFFEGFMVGAVDHHGLANGSGLLSVLLLVAGGAGWIRVDAAGAHASNPWRDWLPERAVARRWFAAGGFAAAVGMWISAPTQAPLLVAIALGGWLATGWLARGADVATSRPDPTLWRVWGTVGAVSTLGFYLLEYFPAHMGMRLEVNHPLYAAAWWGGGELLYSVCRWAAGGRWCESRRCFALTALAAAAMGAPVVALVAGQSRWFLIFDPFVWALHADYIAEFSGIARRWAAMTPRTIAVGMSLVPLVVVPLAWWGVKRDLPRPLRALAVLCVPPGIVTLVLASTQIRWLGISCATWIAGLVAAALVTELGGLRWTRGRRVAAAVLLAAVCLPSTWQIVSTAVAAGRGRLVGTPKDIQQVVVRDVAQWLRARLGSARGVVLASPSASASLVYHGGLTGIASFYWENADGLKAAAQIFSAENEAEARRLAARRGITHIVLFSWGNFADGYVRLAHGWRLDHAVPRTALAFQLLDGQRPPPWLRAICYQLPEHAALRSESVRVFEVVPEQTPAEACTRHAQFLLDCGDETAAERNLREAVAMDERYAPAWIAWAQLRLLQERMPEFAAMLARVRATLSGTSQLELTDQAALAVVFDAAGDAASSRKALEACLVADDTAMRRLSAEALFRCLFLVRRGGLAETRRESFERALRLLPTDELRQAVRNGIVP
jgi:hypothetical protein